MEEAPRNNLRLFRTQLGLSAHALSRKVGVAPQTISRIESGFIRHPRYLTKAAIADVLGVLVKEVFPSDDKG